MTETVAASQGASWIPAVVVALFVLTASPRVRRALDTFWDVWVAGNTPSTEPTERNPR